MLTRRTFLGVLPAIYGSIHLSIPDPHEYHVSVHGNDAHEGTTRFPLRTISAAAVRAMPGDTITVHQGVYRERVAPPRGGTSDDCRIVYRAAPGERVEITGAEIIKGWKPYRGDVWTVTVSNSFFGAFNPYSDVIHGDWFSPLGRTHHTGAVYLNGDWLAEAKSLDDVLETKGELPLWFGQVDSKTTTLWAQFRGADPNRELTEINVRQTVFYPEKIGMNFITVRDFILRCAATPWAPPTAEQIGLVGTHWSKGWIIENNTVSYSICSGISLGKYGDQWDNTSANSAEGYVKTIERAEKFGWSKENIGHHIVRNNIISHCEQTGIVGSLGPAFSTITGNVIHDIYVRRHFSGAEIAGIKFHAAIDVELSNNHIFRSYRGLWLDWMAQGTRVTSNLFHDNVMDAFFEVDHGPFIVDNNIFLSKMSLDLNSQGGAFVHNLICGGARLHEYDGRMTPYLKPHSTEIAGDHDNPDGDLRFINNLLAENADLSVFNHTRLPMQSEGNVFLYGAKPCSVETSPRVSPEFDPQIQLTEQGDGYNLEISLDGSWASLEHRKLVTSDLLDNTIIPNLPFQQPDGRPVRIDKDYFGQMRNPSNPVPGPFEFPQGGRMSMKVFRSGHDLQVS
jgi:alpha-N-arabinofuranosidase